MVNSNSKTNVNGGSKKVYKIRVKCQYCGIRLPSCDMTKIPQNKEQLAAWIEILGPEFSENIRNFKSNHICLSHIENGDRGPYRLPKNVNNVTLIHSKPKIKKVPTSKMDGYRKCRYCGVSRPQCETTSIPSNTEQLSKWIEILGPKFSENIKKYTSNTICLSHFESKTRSPYRLPKKMDNIDILVTDENEKEVDGEKTQKKTKENKDEEADRIFKKAPDVTNILEKDVEDQEEEDQNQRMEKEDKDKEYQEMDTDDLMFTETESWNTVHPNQEYDELIPGMEVENSDDDDQNVENEQNQEIYEHTKELVSSKPGVLESGMMEMEKVENSNSAVELEQEMEEIDGCIEMVSPKRELLDPGKMENEMMMVQAKSATEENDTVHPNQEYVELIPVMEVEDTDDDAQNVEKEQNQEEDESVQHEKHNSEMIEMRGNVTHTNSIKMPENSFVQCRACNVRYDFKMMTPVPTDPETLKKWIIISGPQFLQNISQCAPPHFICLNDMRELLNHSLNNQ